MAEVLYNLIIGTALITLVFGCLWAYCAWSVGGKFYITADKGRKKGFLERLLDGFEKMEEM